MNATDAWTPGESGTTPTRRTAPLWLLIVGLIIFGIGAVFTIIGAVVPYITGGDSQGWFYLVSMTATPIGFLMALGYGIFGALPPRRNR